MVLTLGSKRVSISQGVIQRLEEIALQDLKHLPPHERHDPEVIRAATQKALETFWNALTAEEKPKPKPKPKQNSQPKGWLKMHGYPHVGQHVRVIGPGIDVTGTVLPSRKNPKSPAFRVRSGAVLATLETDDGKHVTIPWSTGVVTFYEEAEDG